MSQLPKEITTVLADCFDTVIFRREHPFSVFKAWAAQMSELYPQYNREELFALRMKLHRECGSEGEILEGLCNALKPENPEVFKADAYKLEFERECAVQFLNAKTVKRLKDYKKQGKKVVCVSDYHLPAADLRAFLERLGAGRLFDEIYVSSELGATKAGDGALYDRVLEKLDIEPGEALMTGDHKISDRDNAARRGIHTCYIPNRLQHLKNSVERRSRRQDSDVKKLKRFIREYTGAGAYYEEYIVLFYVFTDRLYRELKSQGAKKVVFLSREGHYLKELFETYQELKVPEAERIVADYFKCSRRAIFSVQKEKSSIESFETISIRNYLKAAGFTGDEAAELFAKHPEVDIDRIHERFPLSGAAELLRNEYSEELKERYTENVAAFEKYAGSIFEPGERAYLVDVGWSGRMQHGIADLLNLGIKGYYIGIMSDTDDASQADRRGLIFHHTDSEGTYSEWYHFLRVNTMFYELLLAAPHGSAQHYRDGAAGPYVVEEWDDNERELYEKHISYIQESMLKKFRAMCTAGIGDCSSRKITAVLAKMTWHSAMHPTKERVEFMDTLCNGFSQNFGQQESKLKFNAGSVSVGKANLIFRAEESARYFAKLPLAFYHKGNFDLYPFLGALIHGYTLITRKRRGWQQADSTKK